MNSQQDSLSVPISACLIGEDLQSPCSSSNDKEEKKTPPLSYACQVVRAQSNRSLMLSDTVEFGVLHHHFGAGPLLHASHDDRLDMDSSSSSSIDGK